MPDFVIIRLLDVLLMRLTDSSWLLFRHMGPRNT